MRRNIRHVRFVLGLFCAAQTRQIQECPSYIKNLFIFNKFSKYIFVQSFLLNKSLPSKTKDFPPPSVYKFNINGELAELVASRDVARKCPKAPPSQDLQLFLCELQQYDLC